MNADNLYLTTLESFSDGSRKKMRLKYSESHLIDVLIKTGHLHGTFIQVPGFIEFSDLQITPSGTELLLDLSLRKHASSWKAKITPAFLFLLGALISPVINDIYTWRLKPYITGIVSDGKSADIQETPKKNRSNQ